MNESEQIFQEAVKRLHNGNGVVYPTETCFGLGFLATDPIALEKIEELKRRKERKPVSILIAELSWISMLGVKISRFEEALIEAFWPGGLTLLLEPLPNSPFKAFAAPYLGVRCSSNVVAQALVRKAQMPITATSANVAGFDAPADRATAGKFAMQNKLLFIDDPNPTPFTQSTVVHVKEGQANILREGVVSAKQIERVLQSVS